MSKQRNILLSVVFVFSQADIQAQMHNNTWFRVTVNNSISKQIKLDTELQHRRQNGFDNRNFLDERLLWSGRLWLHYQQSELLKLSLSPIAYFSNYKIIEKPIDEDAKPNQELRFSMALEWKFPVKNRFSFLTRPAFEFRDFISNNAQVLRVRNRIGLQVSCSDKLKLTVYDDLFFNLASSSSFKAFDQNRMGLSLEYPISPQFKVDFSYMFLMRSVSSDDEFIKENNLMLNLSFHPTFRKEKT